MREEPDQGLTVGAWDLLPAQAHTLQLAACSHSAPQPLENLSHSWNQGWGIFLLTPRGP